MFSAHSRRMRACILAALCLVLLVPATVQAKRGSGKTRQLHTVSEDNQSLPWRRVPAHSILLKELNTGRVLYEHESGKRLSPASLRQKSCRRS